MAYFYDLDDRNFSGGNLLDARTLIQNCEYDVYSMFGIKKDKTSIHSVYKIGRIIGDGNFAIVRECRNRKTQKSYALKVINKAKVRGKEHMIENEILILRKISHPNIVKLHEEFETPKEIYLVMELVSGGDLFDAIVANTRFSEPESAYMVRDLASAVHYLHQMQIVHRDIKPENLLVLNRPDGRKSIKLADFGLSIEVKSPMFLVCGTPTYVAPEILEESGYGLKVDVWAVGVICYILLCGFPPFRSTNHDQEELFDKILRGDFEYLSPFWDDVSDGPRDLIDRLLVVDADERYDADEILEHFWIKKWTEPTGTLSRDISEEEESKKESRKRFRGIALSIQAVISLLHLVRSKNIHNNQFSESPIQTKEYKVSFKPNVGSRIPRPKPSAGLHIAEIRKSMTAPIRRQVGYVKSDNKVAGVTTGRVKAPDYLRKGYLKREEAFKENSNPNSPGYAKSHRIPQSIQNNSPKPSRRNLKPSGLAGSSSFSHKRVVASVVDLRQESCTAKYSRPSSAQSVRSLNKKSPGSVKPYNSFRNPPIKSSSNKTKKVERSVSVSTDLSSPTDSDSSYNSLIVSRFKQKYNRPRPRSLIETKITSKNIEEFLESNNLDQISSDDMDHSNSIKKVKEDIKSNSRTRPNTLNLKENSRTDPPSKCTTPTSYEVKKVRKQSLQNKVNNGRYDTDDSIEKNKLDMQSSGSTSSIERPRSGSINSSSGKNKPMRSSSPIEIPKKPGQVSSARRATPRRQPSMQSPRAYVTERNIATRKTSFNTSNAPPWNPSTRPHSTANKVNTLEKQRTPKKSLNHEPGKSIRVTTETNKRKNIKFPDGKTVDKETKTTTTFSVDMDSEEEKTCQKISLIDKVKNLAHEIENLSKDNRLSDSSSDSIGGQVNTKTNGNRSNSDLQRNRLNEETDRFSETEYLSLVGGKQ